MYCNQCGAALPEGAKFCGSCGKPVIRVTEEKKEPTVEEKEERIVPGEDFFERVEKAPVIAPAPEKPAEKAPAEEPKQDGKPKYEPTDFEKPAPESQPAPQMNYQPIYGIPTPPPPKPKTPGKGFAIAAMVLGIIGLARYISGPIALAYVDFSVFLFPLLALVFGCVARGKGCRGMSTAGIVMGIIGLVLFVAGICLNIFYPDWIDDLYIAIYGEPFYFDGFEEEELVRGLSRLF